MPDVFDEIAPASDIFDEVSKKPFPMLPFTGSGEIGDLVASGQYQPPRLPRVGFTPRASDESTLIGPGPFSGMLEAATGRKGEPITQGTARKAGAIVANSVLAATEGALDPKTQAIVLAATVRPEVVIPILTAQMAKSGSTKLAEGIVDLQQGRDSEGVVKVGEAGTELGFAAAPALHASGFVGEPQAGSMAERAGFPAISPRTRPVVPETLGAPRETVIETIRNADARTLAQIQALFPEAKLSREQARAFRNIAFPPVPEPVRPQATAAEVLGRPPGTLPHPTLAEQAAIQEQLRTEQPGIATVEPPVPAAAPAPEPAPAAETPTLTVPDYDPQGIGARERIKRRQDAGATREQAVAGDAADIEATRKWVDDNTREGDVIEASNGRRYRRDEEGNWYEIQDGKVRSGSRMGDNSGFRGGKIVQRGTNVRGSDDAVIAGEEPPAPAEAPRVITEDQVAAFESQLEDAQISKEGTIHDYGVLAGARFDVMDLRREAIAKGMTVEQYDAALQDRIDALIAAEQRRREPATSQALPAPAEAPKPAPLTPAEMSPKQLLDATLARVPEELRGDIRIKGIKKDVEFPSTLEGSGALLKNGYILLEKGEPVTLDTVLHEALHDYVLRHPELHDPNQMLGMEKAVDKLHADILAREKGTLTPAEQATAPALRAEEAPTAQTVETPKPAKAPWQMTQAEVVARNKRIIEGNEQVFTANAEHAARTNHREIVRDAIAEGRDVPAEVLADYPDLAKPAAAPAPINEPKTRPAAPAQVTKEMVEKLSTAADNARALRDSQVRDSSAWNRADAKYKTAYKRWLEAAHKLEEASTTTPTPPVPPPAPGAEPTEAATPPTAAETPAPVERTIPLINLRESEATPMALGKIKARDPQRWQDIVKYFKVGDTPGAIAKAAQAKFSEPPIRPGPGAASPSEFAERAAKGVAGTPPPAAPVTLDASANPTPEVVRRAKDFNIFNTVNSGQWTFYFGKLGAAAKAAWDKMALSGFAMRENIGRDVKQYVDGLLKSLPRPIRAKGGKAFFEALDGRDLMQIEEAWTGKLGGEQVIAGARAIKTRLEEIRMTILDTKREAYHAFLMGLNRDALVQLFDRNMVGARNVDTSKYTKTQFADGLTRSALPDDWGIADGTYLPRMFFGDWKVIAKRGEESQFVTRAKTVAEAKARIFEYSRTNPEWANAQWSIEPEMAVSGDIVRLGDPRFWRLVQQMKDNLGVSSGEIKQAQQGVIGRTASKQKWFGNLQRRLGLGGYSHDYSATMRAYFAGFHRWLELSKLNREVQPLIDQVRSEGRPHAAEALTDILDHMWGKPAKSTVLFDNFLRRIPGVRDIVKPLFLDRASRNLRAAIAYGTLTTARFAVVNRLQPLQGLYPLVGERILAQAKIRQHTADGRALLDRAGVRFDPGQYGEAAGVGGKAREVLERVRGERSNQELAFLAMYQHGIESGLGDAAAINYAKLRGQLLTQFTPNPADVPPIMRGPLTGLLFQFKRFPLKQGELLVKMAGNGQLGGLARWFGSMAAIGGLGYFMRQLFFVPPDDKERVRRSIEQEHGKTVANGVMYGLPGLLNTDLSGSLVLGDEPFGDNFYEKLGRQISGPGVSLAYETGKALGTAARQPTTAAQQTITQLRRIPALRPVAEVLTLLKGDYDVRSPDGEVKYRKAMRDALMGVGAFRTANEANMQSAVSAIVELKKQESELKNAAFVAVQGTPQAQQAAIDAIQKFNVRWPEVAITPTELTDYIHTRARGMNKTDYERVAGRKFAPLALQPTAP